MSKHIRALSASVAGDLPIQAIAEIGQETITRSKKAIGHICNHNELPDWMKGDPYITQGYRRPTNSFRDCCRSLGYMHNESFNVWSHLLPAIFLVLVVLLVWLDFWVFRGNLKITIRDKAIFQFYIICTICCLLLSALYHCINSHSEKLSRRFLKYVSTFVEHLKSYSLLYFSLGLVLGAKNYLVSQH